MSNSSYIVIGSILPNYKSGHIIINQNMFKFDESKIPTDIQLLMNNKEIGMVLLRLVEIIGADNLENLDPDTLYFISTILNDLDLDSIRNKLLLEVLPLKI